MNRIERYSTAQTTSLLSTANLPGPTQPSSQAPTQFLGSPSASMVTNPSASNPMDNQPPQQFNNLPHPALPLHPVFPAQAARKNPNHSSSEVPAMSSASSSTRPTRTSSMVFTPGWESQDMPPPQPPMNTMQNLPSPSSTGGGILRSDSNRNLDGSEPKMFPGVLGRQRRSSAQRPSSSGVSDGEALRQGWGRRSEVDAGGSVIEESEEGDEMEKK